MTAPKLCENQASTDDAGPVTRSKKRAAVTGAVEAPKRKRPLDGYVVNCAAVQVIDQQIYVKHDVLKDEPYLVLCGVLQCALAVLARHIECTPALADVRADDEAHERDRLCKLYTASIASMWLAHKMVGTINNVHENLGYLERWKQCVTKEHFYEAERDLFFTTCGGNLTGIARQTPIYVHDTVLGLIGAHLGAGSTAAPVLLLGEQDGARVDRDEILFLGSIMVHNLMVVDLEWITSMRGSDDDDDDDTAAGAAAASRLAFNELCAATLLIAIDERRRKWTAAKCLAFEAAVARALNSTSRTDDGAAAFALLHVHKYCANGFSFSKQNHGSFLSRILCALAQPTFARDGLEQDMWARKNEMPLYVAMRAFMPSRLVVHGALKLDHAKL